MSSQLLLPDNLARYDWFVLLWDRDDERYLLLLRDNSSYEIEDGDFGHRYMVRALKGNVELAERCLDTARNFVASVCYPAVGDVLAVPEKFIRSKTVTEILFTEANQKPWPEAIAPSNWALNNG